MVAADLEPIARSIGDDEQWPLGWEIVHSLEEIDARLKRGAAAPPHADPAGDLLGT